MGSEMCIRDRIISISINVLRTIREKYFAERRTLLGLFTPAILSDVSKLTIQSVNPTEISGMYINLDRSN